MLCVLSCSFFRLITLIFFLVENSLSSVDAGFKGGHGKLLWDIEGHTCKKLNRLTVDN